MIRARVREALLRRSEIEVVGEAAGGLDGVKMALSLSPDLVLMDVSMPDLNGFEATKQILTSAPHIKVLAFSADGGWPNVESMFLAGAQGFLLKNSDSEEWLYAIHRVMAGGSFLSPRLRDNHQDTRVEGTPPSPPNH